MAILQAFNTANKAVGSSPRFPGIYGGGSTVSTLQDPSIQDPKVNKDDPSGRIFRFCDRMQENMKQYRGNFDQNWDTYYNMLMGNQWIQPGSSATALRAPRIQSWRARMNINYTYAIMDDIAAVVFDQDPRLSLSATSPEQLQYVDSLQAAVDDVMYRQKVATKCRQAFFNALTYGNGYLKVSWDPSENQGEGQIKIDLVPTQNIFVDKVCTNFQDCEAVLEMSIRPLSQIQRQFPDKAHLLRPDVSQSSFGEKLSDDSLSNNTLNQSLQIYSPAEDQPRIADKTIFTNPPYKRSQGKTDELIEVGELWVKDYSIEEIEERFVTAFDAWRRPIYGLRKKKRRKYPYGRLITFGGGLVLQDRKNPYRMFPPYILFQDIVNTGVFYARGEPELLYDVQREFNKRRSQIMDNAAFVGNSVWIVETDSGVKPSMINNTPGQIIMTKPGKAGAVHRQNPPEMPGWIMRAAELPVGDMMFIAGIAQGGPRGARSGTAMQEAVSAITRRTRMKTKQVEDALIDLGQALITMIQDFYTTSKMIRITGSLGSAAFVPFDRFHVRGQWDIKIEATNSAANSKVARRQEALQLFGMGVIDDRALLEAMEWPGREEVLRRKGRPPAPHQNLRYPGWPGMPSNGGRGDTSGYALSVRAEPTPPPAPPEGGGPPGFLPKPLKGMGKKKGGGGGPKPFGK
jgi:hypothetical protein